MTDGEARTLLDLPDGPLAAEAVRVAYLRRVRAIRLDVDPDAYASLRSAYELASHGAGAPTELLAAARAELAARPDSGEARWRLLSCVGYHVGPQAFEILREGAERNPDEFLDELLFHFPEKTSVAMIERARAGAGVGRLLLIADAYAVHGQPAEALESFRVATAPGPASLPIRLALRPVFSLHAHGQIGAAGEALALLKARAPDPGSVDANTAWALRIADELGRIGDALPLDLRVVAANAARRANFANAPNEARFATERLRPRDLQELIASLGRDAPTLREIFALGRPLNQSGPRDFRIPFAWGTVVLAIAFALVRYELRMRRQRQIDEAIHSAVRDTFARYNGDYERACKVPDSELCRHYREIFATKPDAGTAGGPAESIHR
jgi:hypothetical protein